MISTLANVYNILEKSKEIGIYFWRFFVLLHILHFITIWEALFSLLQPSIKIDLSYRKALITRMLSVLAPQWKTALKRFPNEDVRNSKFIVQISSRPLRFLRKNCYRCSIGRRFFGHWRIKRGKVTRLIYSSTLWYIPSQISNKPYFTVCEMIWCRGTAHLVRRVSTCCADGEH